MTKLREHDWTHVRPIREGLGGIELWACPKCGAECRSAHTPLSQPDQAGVPRVVVRDGSGMSSTWRMTEEPARCDEWSVREVMRS